MGTSCFRYGVTPSSKRADKRLTALAEEKRLRDKALMIIHNHLAYLPREVREAAVYVLGSLAASAEDVRQASHVIAVGTRDR